MNIDLQEQITEILKVSKINMVKDGGANYRLPSFDEVTPIADGDTIELLLLFSKSFCYVECMEYPIRLGRYYGNRIRFDTFWDPININPKFIFDSSKEEWILVHTGYLSFCEQLLKCAKE